MLKPALFLTLASAVWAGTTTIEEEERTQPLTHRIASVLSVDVRTFDGERLALEKEFEGLPTPARVPSGVRLGWHSAALKSPDQDVWVQIDLGQREEFDLVAIIAARGDAGMAGGMGYGFPVRFQVDVSDSPGFRERTLIAPPTLTPFPNPGASPVLIPVKGISARYLRITVIDPWPRQNDAIVALGEVMILNGKLNLAAGKAVRSSSNLVNLPAWDLSNLTDGQSALGPPVAPDPSPSNGHLSKWEEDGGLMKWVQVDLGESKELQEVTLFPTRPPDFLDAPGLGFPLRFRVECAEEATFANLTTLFDTGASDFITPGDNPVSIDARGHHGRFIRITAPRLFIREIGTTRHGLALAEMQVWSGDANVALGRPVQVSDAFDDPRFPRWQPEYLVDGYNSQFRLMNLPDWLKGLAKRGELERKRIELEAAHTAAVNAALVTAGQLALGVVAELVFIGGVLLWRGRRQRRRELEALRRRIASDLHDEIGSNLGTIALVAERAGRRADDAHLAGENFAEVRRIASSTAESMCDLVWMLKDDGATLSELILRMREATSQMPDGLSCSFDTQGTLDDRHLPLHFVRHLYLSFREMLHNALKHAQASRLNIGLDTSKRSLELTVTDDGVGFTPDPDSATGDGLPNLRQRAKALNGDLEITSAIGQGTRIRLHVPLPSSS